MNANISIDILASLVVILTIGILAVYIVRAVRCKNSKRYVYLAKSLASLFMAIVAVSEVFFPVSNDLRIILIYTGVILIQSGVLAIGLIEV